MHKNHDQNKTWEKNNGALEAVLINYSILEPISYFIPTTASKAIAWNAADEAAKTAVDGDWWFQSLIEHGSDENLEFNFMLATGMAFFSWWSGMPMKVAGEMVFDMWILTRQ